MTIPMTPSTQWREQVAADEAERFAAYGQQFAAIQAAKSKKYGPGRALHRKQLTAAQGSLEVLAKLPEFARHGLFAKPKSYPVWLRLSNGGLDRAADAIPDVRGLAIRVQGVSGESALGDGPTSCQCFTLINAEQFAFPKSDEFVAFVAAAAQGNASLLKFLVQRYGLLGGPARLLKLLKAVGKPFGGFATEPLFSAVPMACGPYAVRVRLLPAASNGVASPHANKDWGGDFAARLAQQDLQWELQLQPFVSEALTPIEDASVNWPSPYTTVARLTLPRQDCASPAGQDLVRQVEAAVFDPWQALAAHRPLGDVQRARKVVYFESQKGRSAFSEKA
ncbi:MAG: hypothetical protein FD135_70 [Comamonadaceae bacterium]|nr:MAG: hypothetical protein FD135_70 [Comamonadaceae bacterium]